MDGRRMGRSPKTDFGHFDGQARAAQICRLQKDHREGSNASIRGGVVSVVTLQFIRIQCRNGKIGMFSERS